MQKLDKTQAAIILENVFRECGMEPNSVPLEELESYSSYREESFMLQRIVLEIAVVIFLLLPLFFINPSFDVNYSISSERGLPEYTINIHTILPVKRVIAQMDKVRLPVYEVNGHKYTVEPTRNGNMRLEVELFNGQSVTQNIKIDSADVESPKLIRLEKRDGKIYLFLKDDISGINYDSIYMVTQNGEKKPPEECNREKGYIVYGEENVGNTIFIRDNFENLLQIVI